MPRFRGNADFRHDTQPALGVLLSNLGTPAAPTRRAVRRYLREFLSDPRVVEVPRPLWWLILNGIILQTRPARSARAYAKVWTEAGSPLLVHTLAQRDRLAATLAPRFDVPVHVEAGMRYGEPSIAQALERLESANCSRVVLLPLYPQYSATTTASTFDEFARLASGLRRIPSLHFIDSYHDNPAYIAALADSVRAHWKKNGQNRLLMSFHGIPERYRLAGDPYPCLCHKTARLLANALELRDDQWAIAFQSRLGREEWLRPYTDELLSEWAAQKAGDIDVICPGFSADCLETLEEIGIQYKALYEQGGGGRLRYIPALNEDDAHIGCLAGLVERALKAFGTAPQTPPAVTLAQAKKMGAQQ